MTISDLCVDIRTRRDGDHYCQRIALDGLYLCHGHRRELARLITEMPARYDDLNRPLGPASPTGGGSDHGITIDEAAATLRSQIQHDLLWWCIYVADARGITRPGAADIHATTAWLTRHIDWCAANRPAAEELLPVLRELTGRTYGITDTPARYLDLGEQCLTHEDGDRCTGMVTIVIRGDDWVARCPTCEVDQDATPYLRLARRGQWITAAEVIHLAGLFGIAASEDVVRQWKHRRRIRGRLGHLQNEYDLRSVQRYLVQRQAEMRRISA